MGKSAFFVVASLTTCRILQFEIFQSSKFCPISRGKNVLGLTARLINDTECKNYQIVPNENKR